MDSKKVLWEVLPKRGCGDMGGAHDYKIDHEEDGNNVIVCSKCGDSQLKPKPTEVTENSEAGKKLLLG